MEERLKLIKGQLDAAITDFETALRVNDETFEPPIADLIRNGQVQKFEFTVELFWKTVKVFLLEVHGLDIPSPKLAVKKYFELGYVNYDELDKLLHALDIRNSLSHVYAKDAFLELHTEISAYRGFFPVAAQGML